MKNLIDITVLLPENVAISTGLVYPCFYTIKENLIEACYYTPVRNQYKSTNGIRVRKQILPRSLPSTLTWRVLGVLKAEMSVGKNNGQIQFSNFEPEIIKLVINWLKLLGISSSDLTWRITFNGKLRINESEIERTAREFAAKEFWSSEAGVSINKCANKWLRYSKILNDYGKMKKETPLWGTLTIEGGNTALRAIIVGLLQKTSANIGELNSENIALYLDGFFSGEGTVRLNKRTIIIPQKNVIFREKIKVSMRKLDFTINKDAKCRSIKSIVTGGVKGLFIAYKNGIFKMAPLKRVRLLENLLNIQRFCGGAKPFKNEIKNLLPQINKEYRQLSLFLKQRKEKFESLKEKYKNSQKIGFKKYT